jgi:hypothetical protein
MIKMQNQTLIQVKKNKNNKRTDRLKLVSFLVCKKGSSAFDMTILCQKNSLSWDQAILVMIIMKYLILIK